MQIDLLQKKIGYSFNDRGLAVKALTHPSCNLSISNVSERTAYQRLEFVGDAVISLAVVELLYRLYPEASEGELTLMRNNAVMAKSLALIASRLDLHSHVIYDPNQGIVGGISSLENTMESLIGAVFLDSSYSEARRVINDLWPKYLFSQKSYNILGKNPKTRLQEYAQSLGLGLPKYQVIDRTGPEHEPQFLIQVILQQHNITAQGQSKKEAEQQAASLLLQQIESWA